MKGTGQVRQDARGERWRSRLTARWGSSVTIRSPYTDHPDWAITEKQHVLLQNIATFPDWSEARRAKMLGVSPKMVHHNIVAWLERGLLQVTKVGARGLKWLQVRKDWAIGAVSPAAIIARITRWRNERTPATASIAERLRVMLM